MTTAELTELATIESTTLSKFNVTRQALAKIKTDAMGLSVRDNGIKPVEAAHKELKRLNSDIDKTRRELKAPAWEQCQTIDRIAKELTKELEPAISHLQEERDVYDAAQELKKKLQREAEQKKTQDRIDRLNAAGCAVDLYAVTTLTDDAFDLHYAEALQVVTDAKAKADADAAALEEIRQAELAKQQEELRIRAEELAAEKAKNDAAMAKQREEMEYERAQMLFKQREADKLAAQLAAEKKLIDDAKAEELAAEQQKLAADKAALAAEKKKADDAETARKAEAARIIADERKAEAARVKNAETARLAAEAEARRQALLPEIEKAELLATELDEFAAAWFQRHGTPAWTVSAMAILNKSLDDIIAHVKGL